MFSEAERQEFLNDGLSEQEIELLESTMELSETVEMIPENVAAFIDEYKTKIPDDTINGMRAIVFAAQHDPKFYNELMALNLAMAYEDSENPSKKQVKVLEGLTNEEYKRASDNYFKTLAGLSESDRTEFLNLIVSITPEQKADMINRIKRN